MIEIFTERLYLRTPSVKDAETYSDYRVRNKAKHSLTEPSRTPQYFTTEYWRKVLKTAASDVENDLEYRFCVFETLKRDDLTGLVNLYNVRRGALQCALLGYSVDQEHEGKGFATEAVSAVVKWAFDVGDLQRLEAGVLPDNLGSIRVLEKTGFTQVGLMKRSLRIQGEWRDHCLYDQTNKNWKGLYR